MDKFEVAQILREIGTIIELIDKNPKKGISYRKASRVVESIPNLKKSVEENTLESYPGIGEHISSLISTLVKTGSLPYYDHLKNSIPKGLLDLAQIPGLRPSKVRILYEKFHITSLSELEKAFKSEKIPQIKGFGPSFFKKIINQIASLKSEGYSLLYPQALSIAAAFVEILKKHTQKIEIAGALRRKLESINQLDLVAVSDNPEDCLSIFTQHGLVKEVIFNEDNRAQVLLKEGIIANLHIVEANRYALTLLHLTGNEDHLKALKEEAEKLGHASIEVSNEDEWGIYRGLGLTFIVPELREGDGEIEAAREGTLPHLIEVNDLRGTFHCHTKDSDGSNNLEEMAAAAKKLGWEYIGISDHSKSSYQANGLNEERLLTQIENIHKLNAQLEKSFQVFAGIECDILKDGLLDFSDDILKMLDFVIVSIHRRYNLDKDEMTKRLIKAIENPYTTMIGHLTGRLLRHRDAYQLDIPKVIDACVANHKIIELNSTPSRLDMDWRWWKRAKDKGLKCSINPDAHSIYDLVNCKYGINMARKGWLEKNDVINTLSLQDMRLYLKNTKRFAK